MRNQSCSIRLRGSELEDRNRNTKKSGKTPCTASPEPVRSPTNAPTRRERERDQQRQREHHQHTGRAGRHVQAGGEADREVDHGGSSATTITPARLPISSADRRIGVSASRLMKPVSTSRARLVPALIEANSEPWMNGNAIAKSR